MPTTSVTSPAVPSGPATADPTADGAPTAAAPQGQSATRRAVAALKLVVAAKPGATERAGQTLMTQAVAAALTAGQHLLVEAGTGTGKSFGYLVPAILHATDPTSGPTRGARREDPEAADDADADGEDDGEDDDRDRVVIATATKALQEQLVEKDLPFLHRALAPAGHRFTYAMLKGRSNYLCRARWAENVTSLDVPVLQDAAGNVVADTDTLDRLRQWEATTSTGDRAEVEVSDAAWARLSISATECPGARACPLAQECFAYAARDRARTADVVVVNTALYGAHLASGGRVLPGHKAVVFDEAHTLEAVMAEALSTALSPARVRAVAYALRNADPGQGLQVNRLFVLADDFAAALATDVGRRVNVLHDPYDQLLADLSISLDDAVVLLKATADDDLDAVSGAAANVAAVRQVRQMRRAQVGRQATSLRDDVDALRGQGADGGRHATVTWVEESSPGHYRMQHAPVEVGPKLASMLFPHTTVVATSATLQVARSFTPLARRLGLPVTAAGSEAPAATAAKDCLAWSGVLAPSPFDYPKQGYLYVARHLPEPNHARFRDAMHVELTGLAQAAGGRTLALFTSRVGMLAAAEHLRAVSGLRVLVQGEASRTHLLEEFTREPGSVLAALASFWTGVDIPGPALSLVTIDKIPFPRRDDPLVAARREAAGRRGGNGFAEVDIPAAACDLAQGTGRLIRTTTDKGVVAIFDSRLGTKSYGRPLLSSLPDLYLTDDGERTRAALCRLVAALE